MTRDWTPSDQADADDDRRHREWWKRPDPFDPNNDDEDDPTPGSDAAVERGCTARAEEFRSGPLFRGKE